MGWFKKKSDSDSIPAPPVLTPGECECGHIRCVHDGGTGRCNVSYPPDAEWTNGAICACKIFILDPDSGGGDEEEPETPSPQELEKLFNA